MSAAVRPLAWIAILLNLLPARCPQPSDLLLDSNLVKSVASSMSAAVRPLAWIAILLNLLPARRPPELHVSYLQAALGPRRAAGARGRQFAREDASPQQVEPRRSPQPGGTILQVRDQAGVAHHTEDTRARVSMKKKSVLLVAFHSGLVYTPHCRLRSQLRAAMFNVTKSPL